MCALFLFQTRTEDLSGADRTARAIPQRQQVDDDRKWPISVHYCLHLSARRWRGEADGAWIPVPPSAIYPANSAPAQSNTDMAVRRKWVYQRKDNRTRAESGGGVGKHGADRSYIPLPCHVDILLAQFHGDFRLKGGSDRKKTKKEKTKRQFELMEQYGPRCIMGR